MPKTLSETAVVIISNAATRADLKVLPVPIGLKAPAVIVRKTLAALLKDGLLAEVRAGRDDGVWEQDEQHGRTTLVATTEGLKAVGIEDAEAAAAATGQGGRKAGRTANAAHKATPRPTVAKSRKRATSDRKTDKAARGATSGGRQTKQGIIVEMLRRGGASIEEMAHATGWQPHSVRGVLTATIKGRLKLPLVSEKDASGTRRYPARHGLDRRHDRRGCAQARPAWSLQAEPDRRHDRVPQRERFASAGGHSRER